MDAEALNNHKITTRRWWEVFNEIEKATSAGDTERVKALCRTSKEFLKSVLKGESKE